MHPCYSKHASQAMLPRTPQTVRLPARNNVVQLARPGGLAAAAACHPQLPAAVWQGDEAIDVHAYNARENERTCQCKTKGRPTEDSSSKQMLAAAWQGDKVQPTDDGHAGTQTSKLAPPTASIPGCFHSLSMHLDAAHSALLDFGERSSPAKPAVAGGAVLCAP